MSGVVLYRSNTGILNIISKVYGNQKKSPVNISDQSKISPKNTQGQLMRYGFRHDKDGINKWTIPLFLVVMMTSWVILMKIMNNKG